MCLARWLCEWLPVTTLRCHKRLKDFSDSWSSFYLKSAPRCSCYSVTSSLWFRTTLRVPNSVRSAVPTAGMRIGPGRPGESLRSQYPLRKRRRPGNSAVSLGVTLTNVVRYRRVRLLRGTVVLSETGRLAPEINGRGLRGPPESPQNVRARHGRE